MPSDLFLPCLSLPGYARDFSTGFTINNFFLVLLTSQDFRAFYRKTAKRHICQVLAKKGGRKTLALRLIRQNE